MGYPNFDKGEERIAQLEHELHDLEQQYYGLQMMLAFVLKTTGPVFIKQETLVEGIEKGQSIAVEDDLKGDGTRVSLTETPVDAEG